MRYCDYCGKEISNEDTVCPHCGMQLAAAHTPESDPRYGKPKYGPGSEPEIVAEPVVEPAVEPAAVEEKPTVPEAKPEPAEPKKVEKAETVKKPEPAAEPEKKREPAKPKSSGGKKRVCAIGAVACVVLIIVGLALMLVPTSTEDAPNCAYVSVTVYNDEDEAMSMTATGAGASFVYTDSLPADYFQYNTNFVLVTFEGDSMTLTVTAQGTGLDTGHTWTATETVTLLPGQEYRLVLHL